MRDADIWPCRAAEEVPGDSAKVSRSFFMADDCLSAELKRVFYILHQYRKQAGSRRDAGAVYHYVSAVDPRSGLVMAGKN